MSIDPRTELTRLLDALEAHLTAVVNRSGELMTPLPDDTKSVVVQCLVYEDPLEVTYNEVTP